MHTQDLVGKILRKQERVAHAWQTGPPGTASTYTPAMPKHAGVTFRHARIIDPQMTAPA
jgi:hypothetical protein